MDAMIDLLPLSLLLLLLCRARPVKPLSAFDGEGLSLQAAMPLRGALALTVVLHHLAQRHSEVPYKRTADTAGIQLVYLDARLLHETAVDADLSEFIFDQHHLLP